MALLPSGYKRCNSVNGTYNTGIVSQSGLEINAVIYSRSEITEGAIFGARNTNSNTSAGQLFVSVGYFGYRNARVAHTTLVGASGFMHIYVNDNELEINNNVSILTATGSQGTFTGTRQMYLNAYNNAGTQTNPMYAQIYGFVIKRGSETLTDFVPCMRESDSVVGLYDLVSQSFITPMTARAVTMYSVSVQQAAHGQAHLKTARGDLVDELMSIDMVLPSYEVKDITAVAVPEAGYEFVGWEVNGGIVSRESSYRFGVSGDRVLTPVFQKITSIKLDQSYSARVLSYGSNMVVKDFVDLRVISASIQESGIERTSSQIVCESVPTSVVPGCFVQLISPRNKKVYLGMVESVDNDTLNCREMLAYFDMDYLMKPGIIESNNTVHYGINYLISHGENYRDLSQTDIDGFDYFLSIRNGFLTGYTIGYSQPMSLYHDQISNVVFPAITETGAQNLEDLVLQYTSFGIFLKVVFDVQENEVSLEPYYYKNNDVLSFGDNLEDISNVQITEGSQQGTMVAIFSSAGALRGYYGALDDGSIMRYDTMTTGFDDFLAKNNYVGDVVLSDDPISTILAEKLSSSFLNHKITFDITFNRMLTFDKMKVGTPVEFYVGNRLFKSVITGVKYEILQNNEDIMNAQITLGSVRTSLTSKLNLRKSK